MPAAHVMRSKPGLSETARMLRPPREDGHYTEQVVDTTRTMNGNAPPIQPVGNTGRRGSGARAWPHVSVVIPVRNESEAILRAVESVLNQDYPGFLDVIIADGVSTDGTRTALDQLVGQDDRVSVVTNVAKTTPAGLNAAIAEAQGEVIVRCDAHSVLPPAYVRTAVEILDTTGADNVGGIQAAVGIAPVERAIATAMSIPLGVGNARFHYHGEPGPADTVYLGVFRRQVFETLGLFDELLIRNQDFEMNYRIRKAGGLVYFDPRLRVEYRPRSSLAGLWKQYWQYGRWKRIVLAKHPRSLRPRQLAPPLAVLGLIGSFIAASQNALWLGVPGLYAVGLVTAAVWMAIRRRDAALLLLAPALAVMHIAWGLGFLSVLAWRPTRIVQ